MHQYPHLYQNCITKIMEPKATVISYPDPTVLLPPEKAWELFANKDFRVTATQLPFNPALVLCDVRMAKRFQEDTLYEKKPKYMYNLRRGMSFIMDLNKCDPKLLEKSAEKEEESEGALPEETKGKKGKQKKKPSPAVKEEKKALPPLPKVLPEQIPDVFMIARKGLQKFFDVTPHYLEEPFKLPNNDNKANYIFWPLEKQLQEGAKIEICATRKANGENAQVSYLPSLGMWCIGSKNVSICIRDEKDLEYFVGTNRYHFASEIADVWLKVVSQLKLQNRLEEFKKAIANKTLVGEYVGNVAHQHLVAYSKETIVFYALIDHNSGINCDDPNKTLAFFKDYGLDYVSYESRGVFNTLKEVREALLKEYIETGKASLYNEEEGVVIYFVKRGGIGEDCTLSLCKIKTLEYRLYRKLRETLRQQMSKSMRNFLVQSMHSCRQRTYTIPERSGRAVKRNIREGNVPGTPSRLHEPTELLAHAVPIL
eukprot:TRINITY_DN127_c0_g1_i1.p1 TRINITY_DN127_c0_g1~~TRINITY_DN127_c0_g1_i1.p1  ORF type:complete len:483 (-),score=52.86 TRINITY_DN127_c0_g1_i1:2247-3695(-)